MRKTLILSTLVLCVIDILLAVWIIFGGINLYNLIPFLCLSSILVGFIIAILCGNSNSGIEPTYKEVINYANLNKLGRGKW